MHSSTRCVALISVVALGLGCKRQDQPLDGQPAAASLNPLSAERMHLGDGVNSYNYYFIAEELKRAPGSAENTREVERFQRKAQQTSGMEALKPPSANVGESEFSHLLGAVAESNGGIGAAVFDSYGLKKGAAGAQLELMVLESSRLRAVAKIRPEDPPIKERYTCERLRELAESCDPAATRGVPCWGAKQLAEDCSVAVIGYYRPVLDYDDSERVLGVSMIVVEQ